MEILDKVQQLKAELDSLRPLDTDIEARIWQKFRLDWNYHSNKLEGNTYSYGETRMLLLTERTAGGKPKRDSDEILGHDKAIDFVIEHGKQGELLTESFIRHLHKLILVEPFWSEAKTSDGKPTKRLIKVGEYKTEPNHVETITGEKFRFAEPIETPAKMQELVEWFSVKAGSPETNPILLAAEFHYRFVLIHPFDDGNGRLARLLMNFILMKYDFPPVIIRNEDKDNYIAALEQANFTVLEPFVEYIAINLARSLEIMLRGARGEDIEEPEDFDKELALLERKLRSVGRKVNVRKSISSIVEVFNHSLAKLAEEYFAEFKKFNNLFLEHHGYIHLDGTVAEGEYDNAIHYARVNLSSSSNDNIQEIRFSCMYIEFNQDGLGDFRYESRISINFHAAKYTISTSTSTNLLSKLYTDELSDNEIRNIVKLEKNMLLEVIKEKVDALREKDSESDA